MTVLAIILLILLGLLLLLIEFTVLPGVTIAGIGGFVLLGFSVYIAFNNYGNAIGFLTLAVVLIASPLMIVYLFKSRSGKGMILNTLIDGRIEEVNAARIHPGDTGKTLGRLAPSGKVRVNGEVVEGQSTGILIDPNTEIRVLKILSNKIVVEPLNKEKND